MKKFWAGLTAVAFMACMTGNAAANVLDYFQKDSSWKQFQTDETDITTVDYVNPGYGGQAFDAEYLFYKIVGDSLYIGLQTGFNLETGKVWYNNAWYYAGDLALSFDHSKNVYEYAVDFGRYPGTDTGDEKFYSNVTWKDPDTYAGISAPYAMKSGIKAEGLEDIINGHGTSDSYTETVCTKHDRRGNCTNSETQTHTLTSYYTVIELSLADILGDDWEKDGFDLSVHWTQSCGNDEINGAVTVPGAPVPEPATMLLFGTGIAGLAGVVRRHRMSN